MKIHEPITIRISIPGQNDNSSVPPSHGHPHWAKGHKGDKISQFIQRWMWHCKSIQTLSESCMYQKLVIFILRPQQTKPKDGASVGAFPPVSPCIAKWLFQTLVSFQQPLHFSSVLTWNVTLAFKYKRRETRADTCVNIKQQFLPHLDLVPRVFLLAAF